MSSNQSLKTPRYQVFVKTNMSLERADIPRHVSTIDGLRKFIMSELDTYVSDDELMRLAFTGLALGTYDNGMVTAEAEVKLCQIEQTAPLV